MILVSRFVIYLFKETVILSYFKQKKLLFKNFLLSKIQEDWVEIQIKMYKIKPEPKINS